MTGLSEQQLAEIAARAGHLYEYVPQTDEADQLAGTDVPALLAEVASLRADLEPFEMLTGQQCAKGIHPDWLVDSEHNHACPWCRIAELLAERHSTNEALSVAAEALRAKDQRIAELETAAVDARAALGALCYDLEDPGSNAFGALHLLSQATVWVDAQSDDAAMALAKHDAKVLRQAAETLEATDRDDDAVNLLYLLADGTEKAARSVGAGDPR